MWLLVIFVRDTKAKNVASLGLLQPLAIPEHVWYEISMDFIDGLPKSDGKDTIFVIVDRLSKDAHFIPLKHPYTVLLVARTFLDNTYRLHGLPKTIVSDKDMISISHFWKELFQLQKVQLHLSTTYHPQLDGQIEFVNTCLENYLMCMCNDNPKQWYFWLAFAKYSYNTNFHLAIRSTTYEVIMVSHLHCTFLTFLAVLL